tara:strand:+ start:92 stop:607 length:516 start_codon:yes stop_codon:yes gene_type:complete
MKLKLLLILLIAVQFVHCQSNPKNDQKEINRNGYSISYPSSMRLDESGRNGIEFLLFTEKTNSNDNFRDNLNLIIQNLENLNINLDKFVEITETQIKNNGKLILSERIKSDNYEFQRLVYEANLNNFDLKFIQYDFVKDEKAYILTFSVKLNEYDKYNIEMESIMSSFKLE